MNFNKFANKNELPEIVSCENYLQSVCEEYDICYETCEFNHPDSEVVNEGILSSIWNAIKSIFKGVIKVLVAIWKVIVAVVKKIWNGLKALYRFIFGKKEVPKKPDPEAKSVNVAIIEAANSVVCNKFNTNNIEVIKKAYERSIKSISSKIDRLSRENIEFMKKMEKDSSAAVKESIDWNVGYDEGNVVQARSILRDRISGVDYVNFVSNMSGRDASAMHDDDGVTVGSSLIDYYGMGDLNATPSEVLETVVECQGGLKEIYDILVGDVLLTARESHKDRFDGTLNSLTDKICRMNSDRDRNTVESIINTITRQLSISFRTLDRTFSDIESNLANYGGMLSIKGSDIGLSVEKMTELYNEFLVNKYFPRFYLIEDPNERINTIKAWCQSKIAYNKTLIENLKAILKANEMVFSFSSREIIADIDNGDYNSAREILQKIIPQISEEFDDSIIIDGSKYGMGTIIINSSMNIKEDFRSLKYNSPLLSDEAVQYLAYYDLTLQGHGGNSFPQTIFGGKYIVDLKEYIDIMVRNGNPYSLVLDSCYEKVIPAIITLMTVYAGLEDFGIDLNGADVDRISEVVHTFFSRSEKVNIDKLSKAMLKNNSKALTKYGDFGEKPKLDATGIPIYGYWSWSSTPTPDRKCTFSNIFAYLYYVTHVMDPSHTKYKRILIGACNPSGMDAPKWIYESPVEFRISARSVFS